MFGWDQRQRLLREFWTAPALAEEIFAMMSPDVPNNTDAQVAITQPVGSKVAPIQIGNYDPGAPVIHFSGRGGEDLGSWAPDFTPQNSAVPGSGGGGGGGGGSGVQVPMVFPGQVISGGPGTGPYQMNIFPQGISGPSQTVSVTQLQLSGMDTIPPGKWTLVVQVGPRTAPLYYMQFPTWVL